MKIYLLVTSSYDDYSVEGIYYSKEEAFVDADFIAAEANRRSKEGYGRDDYFRARCIRVGDVWFHQSENKSKDAQWGEWSDPMIHAASMYVEECEIRNLSLQQQVDAINEWQNNGHVHQLTCGKDSNHPNLVPYYDVCWPGIGLKCIAPNCDWSQKPNHSILSIVYASHINNRTQAGEAWRLRQLRQTQGDSSPHAGSPNQAP